MYSILHVLVDFNYIHGYISKKTVGFTFIYSHLDTLMISFLIVECKSPMTDFVNSKMYSCPFCCCVNDCIM